PKEREMQDPRRCRRAGKAHLHAWHPWRWHVDRYVNCHYGRSGPYKLDPKSKGLTHLALEQDTACSLHEVSPAKTLRSFGYSPRKARLGYLLNRRPRTRPIIIFELTQNW